MTRPPFRLIPFLCLFLPLLFVHPHVLPAAGEEEKSPAESAVEFLRKLEEKNKEIESLHAGFDQVRIDSIFLDEVKSSGHFWYQAPGKFRASYDSRHPSEIWIFEDHTINYIPSIEQVEIYPLPKGDDAPINQMLLGFGVQTERILEVFDVKALPREEDGLLRIEFLSKDLERSLFFSRIVIHFEEEEVQPRVLILEDDQSEITVTLREIIRNPEIEASRFEPSWPEDAEVLDSR